MSLYHRAPRKQQLSFYCLQKSWDIALGPFKQIPMNLFIMYMAGNSISIFPIMMVGMMFLRPVKALLAIKSSKLYEIKHYFVTILFTLLFSFTICQLIENKTSELLYSKSCGSPYFSQQFSKYISKSPMTNLIMLTYFVFYLQGWQKMKILGGDSSNWVYPVIRKCLSTVVYI